MQAESTSAASEVTVSPLAPHGAEVVPPCVTLVTGKVPLLSTAEADDRVMSEALTRGKLSNSEILNDLPTYLSRLPEPQQCIDLIELIEFNKSLFADVPSQTNLLQHDIDVGDSPPIKQHPYRVNPDKRRRLKQQVEYMMQHNIAEPSNSAWSSPCLLVKTNGEDRFCTDFRKINGVTKPDCYPLPRMEDCVDHVGGARFVTKLDLLKGYWQVPLTERAKEISAFVTPDDFLQYTVMPFGMRNAPATFQRLMNLVLSGLPFCEAYLDDLVVCSESWSEHMEHLRVVFCRLNEAGLTVNLAKCEFGQATVVYLGKIVGGGQVRPVQAKVECIEAFPVPTNRTELCRYLAMVGYYRGFCKHFSAVASPLTDLLSPKVDFKWSTVCQLAFEQTTPSVQCTYSCSTTV